MITIETKKQSGSIPGTGTLIETHEFRHNEESFYHSHHHTHEIYQILVGTALVTEGKRAHRLTAQDPFIIIPPRTPHSIKNIGSDSMIFMSIKSGSFNVNDYHQETRSPE